jgi:hypothetical protein
MGSYEARPAGDQYMHGLFPKVRPCLIGAEPFMRRTALSLTRQIINVRIDCLPCCLLGFLALRSIF